MPIVIMCRVILGNSRSKCLSWGIAKGHLFLEVFCAKGDTKCKDPHKFLIKKIHWYLADTHILAGYHIRKKCMTFQKMEFPCQWGVSFSKLPFKIFSFRSIYPNTLRKILEVFKCCTNEVEVLVPWDLPWGYWRRALDNLYVQYEKCVWSLKL